MDSSWYKRAVDQHSIEPESFVFSVPFDAGTYVRTHVVAVVPASVRSSSTFETYIWKYFSSGTNIRYIGVTSHRKFRNLSFRSFRHRSFLRHFRPRSKCDKKFPLSRQPKSIGHGHSRSFHRDRTQSTGSGRRITVSTFFTGLSLRQYYLDGKFVSISITFRSPIGQCESNVGKRIVQIGSNCSCWHKRLNDHFLFFFSVAVRIARKIALPKR